MHRLICVLLCLQAVAASADESADDFVVMSWNLEWFFDSQPRDNRSDLAREMSAPDRPNWDWRRDAVAASIASVRPDVVALQEVESSKVMGYLTTTLEDDHDQKFRFVCFDGAEPFTEQDVALLYADNVWLRRSGLNGQSRKMHASGDYYNVFKHLEAELEIGRPSDPEVVTVINLHLRARAERADIRIRQARLVHTWIADRIAAGENVIVLGDLNTEEPAEGVRDDSDLAILCGKHTPRTDDDLIDLHPRLPVDQRQTHLLAGKAFDRILVSPAMIDDDPDRVDLVLRSVQRPRELSVKGDGPDEQDAHWNAYWQIDSNQRDLSDHWPVVARFQLK
ncbi:endonuclease/exonuclease/phosphatase family protein [Rosistilla oblonga]|uniref:endonuclease/exonuclease/phosphatase family protein n=1 Tax=Rosistilla oblonga TaxID=2527990 RepID=UPI003A96F44C